MKRAKRRVPRRLVWSIVLAATGTAIAGNLNPPGPPAPTMVTLQHIFDSQHPGSDTCFDNVGTNRFVDCGSTAFGTSNGAVKDAQTGLVWLKNANCFGATSWADANIKAAALASGQCGLTDGSKAGDWRLPTKAEWMTMFRPGCYPSPGGPTIADKTGNACYAGGTPWANGVQSADYWSSTTNADPTTAWALDLFSGNNSGGIKTFNLYVWPVRAAAQGPAIPGSLNPPGAPAPTMATLLEIYNRQHAGSDPCFDNVGTNRFVDCATNALGTGNGTVKDMVSSLIWLKNANCFGLITWANANIKAGALASGQCGLSDGSKPGDWRLPTLAEWEALNMPGCYPFPGGPTIPDRTGNACYLTGIQWATNAQSDVYWSSTPNATIPGDAWAFDLFSREVNGGTKTFNLYVWPVRNGR